MPCAAITESGQYGTTFVFARLGEVLGSTDETWSVGVEIGTPQRNP
jgi:hypothetical protein